MVKFIFNDLDFETVPRLKHILIMQNITKQFIKKDVPLSFYLQVSETPPGEAKSTVSQPESAQLRMRVYSFN